MQPFLSTNVLVQAGETQKICFGASAALPKPSARSASAIVLQDHRSAVGARSIGSAISELLMNANWI
jgi:hypothetical protein